MLHKPLIVLLLAAAPALAPAEEFPFRAVRIVVTTAAGATNDTIARMYAPRLSEQLKQRMIELGAEPVEKSQDESAAFIDLQVEKWAKVILESGAKADD